MSVFSPTDYDKVAAALSKMERRIASQLKEELTAGPPNEHQGELFMRLLSVSEARRECMIASKVGTHPLLGPLTLRAAVTGPTHFDGTDEGDVPPMPPTEEPAAPK